MPTHYYNMLSLIIIIFNNKLLIEDILCDNYLTVKKLNKIEI